MKSSIQPCYQGEQFADDESWERVVFDLGELFSALQDGSVEQLVREVLRPKYQTKSTFHLVVADVVRSVLVALTETLRHSAPGHGLAVILRPTNVDKMDQLVSQISTHIPPAAPYWQGETTPAVPNTVVR